jgi:hypothetical protein
MKDLDIGVFVAVFQEMLGVWLWVGVAAAAVVLLLFLRLLLCERRMLAARLAWAQLFGLAGGVAAILIMQGVTHSSFADIGGPIDWVLVVVIYAVGAVIATIAAYTLLGHLWPAECRPRAATRPAQVHRPA